MVTVSKKKRSENVDASSSGVKTFHCWNDAWQDERDAKQFQAISWSSAARMYAEFEFRQDPFDEMIVQVLCENGERYEVDVEAEQEVHFHLMHRRKVKMVEELQDSEDKADASSY